MPEKPDRAATGDPTVRALAMPGTESDAPVLPHPNLAAVITLHAADRPDEAALVEPEAAEDTVGTIPSASTGRRCLTWAELDRAVTDSARGLARLGVVAGQRVLIEATNSIDVVCAWFGALRAGIIAVPVNPGMTVEESVRLARHSGAVVWLGSSGTSLPGVRSAPLAGLRTHAGDEPVASLQDPEAIAAILYTAGTSGHPKGVMLSHRALIAHCENARRGELIHPAAVVLCSLPLFHCFGLNAVLGAGVYAGSTIVLADGLAGDEHHILRRMRITHFPLTPSSLYRLSLSPDVIEAARTVERVTSGAAPLPAVLAAHWLRLTGTPVEQGYGLTEAAPGVASTVGADWHGTNHVGRPLPGVEVRIGDGTQPTEPGEVFIRGRNLFSGYWPDGTEGPDPDGWFGTGDVGYLMEQDLYLVDRLRDIIIVSGFNVYPSEIEDVLEDHPDVESAAVVGQADEETGERVVAFVTGEAVSAASVLAYAGTRLAHYKRPEELLVLKAMPRSPAGKIRKGLLRDLLDRTDESDL